MAYTIMGYVVRVLLCVLAIMCFYYGVFYVKGPKNRAIERMLNPEFLDAPVLKILVPFLGICYLNLGGFNLLAGLALKTNEACYVAILSGLMFHFGSAIFRSLMDQPTADLYREGVHRRTNVMQYVLGAIYVIIGVITRCLELA